VAASAIVLITLTIIGGGDTLCIGETQISIRDTALTGGDIETKK
jgi:hypothetical protein